MAGTLGLIAKMSCSTCEASSTECLRSNDGLPCQQCSALNVLCSFVSDFSGNWREDRQVDPGRRKWDIKRLSQTNYSSSKDLFADISKIRKSDKRKASRNVAKRQSKSTSVANEMDLTIYPSAYEVTSQEKTWSQRVVQYILDVIRFNDSSVNSRLARQQLAFSLGDHLLSLGMDYSAVIIRGMTTHRLPSTYTSYRELKAGDHELPKYADVWMSYALILGVRWTHHSAILGSRSLKSIPAQTLKDELLDLRQQGYARHDVWMPLMQNCLALAASPQSPLIQNPDQTSLTIILSILSSTQRLQPKAARPLLRIGLDIFRKIWPEVKEQDKDEVIDGFFDALYALDITIHMSCSETPYLWVKRSIV
ncbi:hypothetical protein BT69DRAFT_458393 [Atractiella rhizophila]|nr:hypothetical protein BT69DRAFT_458393 [Atractiella rhizophila]